MKTGTYILLIALLFLSPSKPPISALKARNTEGASANCCEGKTVVRKTPKAVNWSDSARIAREKLTNSMKVSRKLVKKIKANG